ncbi:hypothetical protein VCHA53O466_50535 [Vibrio chagasii]|nr:hypothetical protein VCHA53O466_50535 [Vibrio chagasii]
MNNKINIEMVDVPTSPCNQYAKTTELKLTMAIGGGNSYRTAARCLITKFNFREAHSNGSNCRELVLSHGDLMEYGELFESAGLKDTLYKSGDRFDCVWIIQRLEVLPSYRGYGVSSEMFAYIKELLEPNELVILKPFPLQFEAAKGNDSKWLTMMGYERLPKEFKASQDRLINFYCNKIGFMEWNDEVLYIES